MGRLELAVRVPSQAALRCVETPECGWLGHTMLRCVLYLVLRPTGSHTPPFSAADGCIEYRAAHQPCEAGDAISVFCRSCRVRWSKSQQADRPSTWNDPSISVRPLVKYARHRVMCCCWVYAALAWCRQAISRIIPLIDWGGHECCCSTVGYHMCCWWQP